SGVRIVHAAGKQNSVNIYASGERHRFYFHAGLPFNAITTTAERGWFRMTRYRSKRAAATLGDKLLHELRTPRFPIALLVLSVLCLWFSPIFALVCFVTAVVFANLPQRVSYWTTFGALDE